MKTTIADLPDTTLPATTSAFRFDFPPQVLAKRERIVTEILDLMTKNTLPAIREACRVHNAWLERYPNDYVMLDLGGSLWMLADAIEATSAKAVTAEESALSEPALSASR